MRKIAVFITGATLFLVLPASVHADDSRGLDFFEKKIRPVLVQHCYECHSSDAAKGGLRLDSKVAVQRGGDSGRILVPGKPDESLLLSAMRYQDLEMPPKGKLPETVISDFAQWIAIGAPDPRTDAGPHASKERTPSTEDLWSLQPLDPQANTIDELVTARREQYSLPQNGLADRHTLLRRLYFDLTGLPPLPEAVTAFANDSSSDAWDGLVDRLLASRHFGERWGRHWLDLAQYADSLDAERIFPNRGAWRYRDYVIRSFNEDKPFDQFVIEQIAGDLLPYTDDAQRAEQLVATQFVTLGPITLVNQYKDQLRMDIVDNQVDKVGRVLLGLTTGCARCHDHKFDPLTQEDYYALAGIFHNVQVLDGFRGVSGVFSDWLRSPIPELPDERREREQQTILHQKRTDELESDLATKKAEIERLVASAAQAEDSKTNADTITKLKSEVSTLEQQLLDHVRANQPRPPMALTATEPAVPTNTRITIRGDVQNLGAEVARGVPGVLPVSYDIPETTSGRLELARSIVHPDNPIAARVIVNRVWHHLFGRGLVRTVDNFGTLGEMPSHPRLLDTLAQRFIDNGWRIKPLIREIVLSHTYRLSSDYNENAQEVDPDNQYLWRHSPRRLDAESIRDSLLQISGQLTLFSGGPTLPPAAWSTQEVAQFVQIDGTKTERPEVANGRSVFLPVSRAARKFEAGDFLRQFDFPSPNDIAGVRQSSIVPTQSLYLMNAPFAFDLAQKFADRLDTQPFDSTDERIDSIYLSVYGRPAQPDEHRLVSEFLASTREAGDDSRHDDDSKHDDDENDEKRPTPLARLCHALMISSEFLMHD